MYFLFDNIFLSLTTGFGSEICGNWVHFYNKNYNLGKDVTNHIHEEDTKFIKIYV